MRATFRNRHARGFSIVELMVAMLIGLIGTIIIFQVFEVSEGIKRTTTSGGDAQQNGAIALYVMERDLRSAGSGFNDTPSVGCTILAYDNARTAKNFTMTFAPLSVTSATPAGPDSFSVFYGSQPLIGDATPLSTAAALGSTSFSVSSAFGYGGGDLVVLNYPNQVPAVNCLLREVTGAVVGNVVSNMDAGINYLSVSGTTRTTRFNQPGGLTIAYGGSGTSARVINLGNLYEPQGSPMTPVYNTYAIVNNALTVSSPFFVSGGVPVVNTVSDNIVQMRVFYGLDDGVNNGTVPIGVYNPCDGIVDRFIDATTWNNNYNAAPYPACATAVTTKWQLLIAVRIAVVARSALAEKPTGINGTNCDATTDGTEGPGVPDQRPLWSGGVIDVSGTGDPTAASPLNWKCYRYKVFETTVPLRNWIWRSS
jgi:type IV pilus assembly protein PilW